HLKPRKGAKKSRKRVGRGISAGQGKTAGRGTKGQRARAGFGGKLYRQGGSLPLFRGLPFKRGFTNINRVEWTEINVGLLDGFPAEAEITPEALLNAGLIKNLRKPVVLLGRGEIQVPLNIRLHRVSRGARSVIEAAGGTVEVIEV
ncbi:MAG: 50S ribosomal protein L15, partial [Chloroflexi bacterium RBG_16_48_8]